MPSESAIFVLRIALVASLYGFLLLVVLVVARDLGRGGRAASGQRGRPAGRLVVIGADPSLDLAADSFALEAATTIGRDAGCTVPIPDSFVSTSHALLSWKGGRWWLEDLGSTNGTQLNGRTLSAPARVAFGDVVQVGRVRFKLVRD